MYYTLYDIYDNNVNAVIQKIKVSRPHANIAMDLGSDGNSGFHALERNFFLNIDQINDQNHGCNCDWKSGPSMEFSTPRPLYNFKYQKTTSK